MSNRFLLILFFLFFAVGVFSQKLMTAKEYTWATPHQSELISDDCLLSIGDVFNILETGIDSTLIGVYVQSNSKFNCKAGKMVWVPSEWVPLQEVNKIQERMTLLRAFVRVIGVKSIPYLIEYQLLDLGEYADIRAMFSLSTFMGISFEKLRADFEKFVTISNGE